MTLLYATSSALSWSFHTSLVASLKLAPNHASNCERFVLAQVANLPAYLKPVFAILAAALNFLSLVYARGLFVRICPEDRGRVLAVWGRIPGPGREFICFYRTLVTFKTFAELENAKEAM